VNCMLACAMHDVHSQVQVSQELKAKSLSAILCAGVLARSSRNFIMTYVYSSFSPTVKMMRWPVGLFLACSSAYGVGKIRQDKEL
jgi:hypothetical protein